MLHTRTAGAWLRQANRLTFLADAIRHTRGRGMQGWPERATTTWEAAQAEEGAIEELEGPR
eukprot:2950986-Alexandrium_andersonii.AAC.1